MPRSGWPRREAVVAAPLFECTVSIWIVEIIITKNWEASSKIRVASRVPLVEHLESCFEGTPRGDAVADTRGRLTKKKCVRKITELLMFNVR